MSVALLDTNVVVDLIDNKYITDMVDMYKEKGDLSIEDLLLDVPILHLYKEIMSRHDMVGVVPYVLWEVIPQNASYLVSKTEKDVFEAYQMLLQYLQWMFDLFSIHVISGESSKNDIPANVLAQVKRCLKIGQLMGSKKQKKLLKDISRRQREGLPTSVKYLWQRRYSLPLECILCITDTVLDAGDRLILLESMLVSLAWDSVTIYTKDRQFCKVLNLVNKEVVPSLSSSCV